MNKLNIDISHFSIKVLAWGIVLILVINPSLAQGLVVEVHDGLEEQLTGYAIHVDRHQAVIAAGDRPVVTVPKADKASPDSYTYLPERKRLYLIHRCLKLCD